MTNEKISEKARRIYEVRWVWYHTLMAVELLVIIILLFLMLLSMSSQASPLNPKVMDQLAAQIPIPTTPQEMHQAIARYKDTVEMFATASVEYRLNCYKAFFRKNIEIGDKTIMIHGSTPEALCEYFSGRVRGGYSAPEVDALVRGKNDR